MDMQAKVVWHTLVANDKSYPLALADFSKSLRPLRLDAFEHFVRGLLANDDEPRLRELREAARLDPPWPDPAFALGETYAGRGDCDSALPWFAKVPKTHPHYVEANFAIGVCRLQLNQPDKAEQVFVASPGIHPRQRRAKRQPIDFRRDLPEILNNLGLALAREGKMQDAQADFKHAIELDPDEDDYPFNLGLLAFRANDFNAAAASFREAVQREPDNAEDRALLIQSLDRPARKPKPTKSATLSPKRSDRTRCRQSTSTPRATPSRISIASRPISTSPLFVWKFSHRRSAAGFDQRRSHVGLIATFARAARNFPAAAWNWPKLNSAPLSRSDPTNASAHLGLAEVNRRRYKFDDAITELQASLKSRDSAVVRTTLARIYMEQKKFALARAEAEKALALAPNYTEAKQLLDHLQNPKCPRLPSSQIVARMALSVPRARA